MKISSIALKLHSCLLLLLFISLSFSAIGQNSLSFEFEKTTGIACFQSETSFKNPWTGGFNAPQFWEIHMDDDGLPDLVVFDRTGNKLLTFKKEEGLHQYTYHPEWEVNFPPGQNWIVLKDYNNDGAKDLFTSAGNGIAVFTNISAPNSEPEFELFTDLLPSDYGNGDFNLYVSPVDLPAIEDIDNDGDLDILTFYILGTCVEYHKNLSIELTGSTDTLIYALEAESWGYFTESDDGNTITINDSCGRFAAPRHVGSTLLLHDFDRDNDMDLFLGDVSYDELQVLVNHPMNGEDIITNYPEDYPDFSNLAIPVFPAAFVITEGDEENPSIIIAPNTDAQSINYGESAFAVQTNSTDFDFTGAKVPFLTYQSLDFGRNAYPTFSDIDSDGDLDIVVGNFGKFIPSGLPLVEGEYLAGLSLLRNTGSNLSPEFTLETNDLGGLSSLQLNHLAPALADLNNDSKPDLIVGGIDGAVFYLIQNPLTGDFELENQSIIQSSLDFVVPALQDLDGDGKLDLLLGGKSGRFEYYRNTGTFLIPEFTYLNSSFEQLETVQEGISNFGYSSPAFLNYDNDLFLFSGSESGRLFAWELEPAGELTQITEIDSNFSFLNDGKRIGISIADLNSDNFPDLVVGNQRGGLNMYYGDVVTTLNEIKHFNQTALIYPNPGYTFIRLNNCECPIMQDISIFDSTGRLVKSYNSINLNEPIYIQDLSTGLYFLQYSDSNNNLKRLKIIKQ